MKKFLKIFMSLVMLSVCLIMSACGTTHTHTWESATCTTPKTCSVCGATEGEALGHTWKPATCTTPKTCSVCGATEGIAGHKWQNATCTEPKTCPECGLTEGAALGHQGIGKCTNCNLDFLDLVFKYIQNNGEYDVSKNEYSFVNVVQSDSSSYIHSYEYEVQNKRLYMEVFHVNSNNILDFAFTLRIDEVSTQYPWILSYYSGSTMVANMIGILDANTITSDTQTLPYATIDSSISSADFISSFQKLAATFCKLSLSFTKILLTQIPEGITLYNLGFTSF